MIRKVLTALLLLALALPGMHKAYHAFEDHTGVHCQEDIPNHFHSREYHCSFDQFVLSPFDTQAPLILQEPIVCGFLNTPADQEHVLVSNRILHKFLRAPPSFLLLRS